MSDVERIVNANHERVRWAEEYEEGRISAASSKPRNDKEDGLPRRFAPRNDREDGLPLACGPRNDGGNMGPMAATSGRSNGVGRKDAAADRLQAYRTTALGCAMFTGSGAAFVGIGLSMGRWLTVAIGLVVAALFLAFGAWSEWLAEGADA